MGPHYEPLLELTGVERDRLPVTKRVEIRTVPVDQMNSLAEHVEYFTARQNLTG
ncbi:hypothetical protein [Streptomyces sp. NPDC000134]|uniref:hypothetical protein n=1 Tax=Streptomyces sp. NPDC000134 TaxID=3364536 RepID=UPI003682A46C